MTTEYGKLIAPFKTFRKPPSNLEYITGEQCITRLNEELGWDGWSFEVVENGYHPESDSVWVRGRLTTYRDDGTVRIKEQFGSQAHNRTRDGKNIIDVGFDLKGAATDALKKCATLIGVALYLSEKDGGTPPVEKPAPAKAPPTFEEWVQKMGYSPENVTAMSQQMFENREPKQLTKTEKQRLAVALEDAKKKEMA